MISVDGFLELTVKVGGLVRIKLKVGRDYTKGEGITHVHVSGL